MAKLGAIKYLTIHCAATPEGRDVKSHTISAWDRAKFGQVSYHFVVELNGAVVQTLDLNTKGAHVGAHNTGNVGLCYVGGVDGKGNPKDTRTPAQKVAIRKIVSEMQVSYPDLQVLGHRDWKGVKKACPSFDVATQL